MKFDFWSSTEYSGFMAGLIRELNAQGHDASQRFHISESSYRKARTAPARLFLRFRQYIAYPLQLCAVLLSKRIGQSTKVRKCKSAGVSSGAQARDLDSSTSAADSKLSTPKFYHSDKVCIVSTNTFYAPLIATFFHRNVVHLVYDLFPEAMIHSGKWQEGTLKVKCIRWITKLTLRRAKLNVFLGQRLKEYVESIHGDCGPSAIIAVGADQSLFGRSPIRRSEGAATTILYCGNFGNMHDSATLFSYFKNLRHPVEATSAAFSSAEKKTRKTKSHGTEPPHESFAHLENICWRFHCSGPKRGALDALWAQLPHSVQASIQLGGGLSQEDWIATMETADIALVTMSFGAETVVMPSKTYSAMMAGQAILAIAPEDSDLVDLIKTADCGWWVNPGDRSTLADTLELIATDSAAVLQKRENAYDYAHQNFGQDALASAWIEALDNLH
ncbi:MAG: hypothetical protein ACPGSB_04530 [Opitutales bacterium]